LADQWIPVRPNTDAAMLLAMANVMFKEDSYDKNFVSKFVEPTGFAKWKDYVLGVTEGPDGKIDRTPEWAESICGVPAETIRALTRLYTSSKPCYFKLHWSASSQVYGDNRCRAADYVATMARRGEVLSLMSQVRGVTLLVACWLLVVWVVDLVTALMSIATTNPLGPEEVV
jgi:anaerobic dimethyl sulfoxide reductase subunit A